MSFFAPWIIWIGSGCSLVTAMLVLTWICLPGFPGGGRPLPADAQKRLDKRLMRYLLHGEEYAFLIRMLLFSAGFYALWFIAAALLTLVRTGGENATPGGWLVLIAISLLLVLEICGRLLPDWCLALILVVTLDGLEWLRLCCRWPLWLASRRKDSTVGDAERPGDHAEDKILHLLKQYQELFPQTPGGLTTERRLLRGILQLNEVLVKEVMTPRVDVDGIEDTWTVAKVKAKVVETGHTRLPMYHETIDQIVGIVHAKDLLHDTRLAECRTLAELLRRPVFIPATKNVADLMAEFQQNHNHFAVVLDEYGGTAGIVTFEDILEVIFGEIQDEYDLHEQHPYLRELPDGSLLADARIPIMEVATRLKLELPADQDYETLGGFISTLMGHIPGPGEILETADLTCEILNADPRRVLRVKIVKKANDQEMDSVC